MIRCTYSNYNRISYCHICDLTCKACDGFVENCEHYKDPYGDDNDGKKD